MWTMKEFTKQLGEVNALLDKFPKDEPIDQAPEGFDQRAAAHAVHAARNFLRRLDQQIKDSHAAAPATTEPSRTSSARNSGPKAPSPSPGSPPSTPLNS